MDTMSRFVPKTLLMAHIFEIYDAHTVGVMNEKRPWHVCQRFDLAYIII